MSLRKLLWVLLTNILTRTVNTKQDNECSVHQAASVITLCHSEHISDQVA